MKAVLFVGIMHEHIAIFSEIICGSNSVNYKAIAEILGKK